MQRGARSRRTESVRLPDIGFDHSVTSNWYRPIAMALHSKEQDYATIDNLIELTFKAMDLLTRGRPREIFSASIRRAIRSLCSNGTLDQYREDRIRIRNPERLERYRTQPRSGAPKQTSTPQHQILQREQPQDHGQTPAGDLGNAADDDVDLLIDGGVKGLALPPLNSADPSMAAASHEHDSLFGGSIATSQVALEDDEAATLARFFGEDASPAPYPTEVLDARAVQHAFAGADCADADAFLAHVGKVLASKPGLSTQCEGHILQGESLGIRLHLEARLDGEIRQRIRVDGGNVQKLLRANLRLWYLAPIGVSTGGALVLLRSWPSGADPVAVAYQILQDIQFVKDALSDED